MAEFKLPELGENIASGDLVRVMIAPGDQVSEGQPILELETDKAVIEVPSTVSGKVKDIKVKQGQKLKVGEVIFTTEDGNGARPAAAPKQEAQPAKAQQAPKEEAQPAKAQEPPKVAPQAPAEAPQPPGTSTREMATESHQRAMQAEGKTEAQAHPAEAQRPSPPAPEYSPVEHDGRGPVPAAPSIRRLARELGIDIHNVQGTGPGGRISEEDVKGYVKSVMTSGGAGAPASAVTFAQPRLPDFSKWGEVTREEMRGIRRKTAEHMSQAWNTIPHVTQHDKADITAFEKLRATYGKQVEKAGGKLTITAVMLKVLASALKVFPEFNSSIDMAGQAIIYKHYFHIGVAVDTERGLLVPVIRDVDKKNITQLAAELAQISAKARERKLTPEEMEGGSITITNLGGIGGTFFTPIVNYPEVAILGMTRSSVEPVWNGNEFEPRTLLPLSLSYDHRIIDGANAARFLRWVAEAVEQPFVLALQG